MHTTEWLGIKPEKTKPSNAIGTYGKSTNGKWYGWSHRAINGFQTGDKVSTGAAGNTSGNDYTIKNDDQAKQAAIDFAEDVS